MTIVYEDITVTHSRTGSQGQMERVDTELRSIAIANYDANQKPINSYLVQKRQYIRYVAYEPFYLSAREGTAQQMLRGDQFKSFAYVNGDSKSYVLLNDVERNRESKREKKIVEIEAVSDCDGYYFDVSSENKNPERQYLFGTPADKRDHNLALFAISDYRPEANVYATLKLEKEGRKKGVRLIWLQP